MSSKKRFFTKDKKKITRHPIKESDIGNKSGKAREKEAIEAGKKQMHTPIFPIISFNKAKSPNNSRSITELLSRAKQEVWQKGTWKRVRNIVFFAFLVGVSMWQLVACVRAGQTVYTLLVKRAQLQDDMRLWENIGKQYPTYRDANFQVALLAYRLHEDSISRKYVQQVLLLDPNYAPARTLETMIERK